MKFMQTRQTVRLATLSAVLMSAPAFAEEAGDTNAEITALKRQVGQLMEKIDQISAKQQADAEKQDKIEAKITSTLAQAPVGKGGKPITARMGGVDVRLFGSFDAYIESQRTGAGTVNRLASSGSGYTQLGFDATKDLGNGLSAFGDVRLSYQTDNGKTNSTVRTFNTAVVGLSKDALGTIQAGRMGTQVGEALSTFRLIRLGTGNFIYNPFTTLTHDNVVKYTSPKFANFQASGNIEFGETVGAQSRGRGTAGMLKYDDGKTVALGGIMKSNSPTDISTAGDKISIYSIGASHDFGFVKPFVVMQTAKSDKSPQSLNQNGWYAGVDLPLGPGTLRLESEWVKNKAWAKSDAKSANIRYDWLLNPGVTLYFTATKIWDDANVYYPIVGTGGFAAVAQANTNPLNPSFNTSLNGKSPSSLAAGVKFDF